MSILDSLIQKPDGEDPTNKTIRIACEGSLAVGLDELAELQHYKDLTQKDYEKAKNSILELGFSFPIFIWEENGIKWIIDAHQRKRVLTKMRDEEGYTIPSLPAVRIQAVDRKEAKKKILAQESQYGKIQEEGLYEFVNEDGFVLDTGDLASFVEIDEFEFEYGTEQKEEAAKPEGEPDKECESCAAYHNADHTLPAQTS